MNPVRRILAGILILVTLPGVSMILPIAMSPSHAQEESAGADSSAAAAFSAIEWEEGPSVGRLGDLAEISVSEGYLFTKGEGARQFLELLENPTDGDELGLIFKPSDGNEWFAIFSFSPIGYVKDDEKDNLDADAILESIRQGTAEANKERQRRGWSEMEIVGWAQPPKYNTETNRLEWAVTGRSEGSDVVNFSTRLLGRRGVMSVQLVADPATLEAAVAEFQAALGGFQFVSGENYAEFRQGDKIAKYGLTALIAGGLGAAAAKSGLLGKLWKFLAIGAVSLLAVLKRLFTRKSSPVDPYQA